MADIGGEQLRKIYQPGTAINPGNNLGTTTNRYGSFQTSALDTTNLNVARRAIVQNLVCGSTYSVVGGPITVTTGTTLYTGPGNGNGWIYVYKADYSATLFRTFHYETGTNTWSFANTITTGSTITLTSSTTSLVASVTGSEDLYYKIIFHSSNISNV